MTKREPTTRIAGPRASAAIAAFRPAIDAVRRAEPPPEEPPVVRGQLYLVPWTGEEPRIAA